jgi:IclR family mhp operon transcriptional activator
MSRQSGREDNDFAPTRGALRTLSVLRALNVRNGATVVQLSRDTGISRAALYRLLETLREAGYIALDLAGRHYCLTVLVRSLAEGFTDEDWVTAVAKPALKALQKEILWPTDLGTFMDNSMFIRETTRASSTLTIDRGVVGVRFPMLRSATGRAYLAWCPDKEREQILRNLVNAREAGFELILDRPRLDALLDLTRERGYGCRFGEEPMDSGAIAVPIRLAGRVLGCVNITFMRRAMTPDEAARRYLKPVRATAAEIATGAMRLMSDEAPVSDSPVNDD